MIHWFLTFALPKAEYSAISTLTSAVVVVLFVAPFKGAIRRLRAHWSRALDSLDPDVPVGLTKQLDDVTKELDAMRTRLEGHLHVEVKDAPLAPHSK